MAETLVAHGNDTDLDSLQNWATEILEATKAYKNASGQEGLHLRSKITNNAKQIINTVRDPGETCFQYAVSVRNIAPIDSPTLSC